MAITQDALALAWKLFQAGDLAGALRAYHQIVAIDPSVIAAWQMIGAIHQVQGRIEESLVSYRRVLGLDPNHVETLNNLGVALHSQGRTLEAIECLRRAIAIKPGHADAHNNLGNAFKEQGQIDNAVALYRRALELNPRFFDALNNLGNALRMQGKLCESVAAFERALEVRPDNPQARMSRGLCWLQIGEFEQGWADYEWRLKCKEFSIPSFRQPRWDGSALAGRTILLYADHGFGDSIQFIRYAPMVKARGGRVIVVCRQPLAGIAATCAGIDLVVEEGSPLPDFDVYSPLMSLPMILETRLSNIPAAVPYLRADAGSIDRWRQEIAPRGRFNVGIAWQGNPQFQGDRHRSFRLAQLEPLAWVDGVRLFSLQKGAATSQIDELNGRFAVIDMGNRFSDFMDTASVMSNLDLVITSDSSLAHLAGALGVPIWVVIGVAADWRWLNGRDDNPWYPSMRLFRQKTWGDWDEVFARIAKELRETLEQRSIPLGSSVC